MSKKDKKAQDNAADLFEQMMKKTMMRFAAAAAVDQAVETARVAAQPLIEKGIEKAKVKLTDVAATAMTKLPVEQLMKVAQSGQALAKDAPKMAADLQADAEKLAATLQSDVERMIANAQPTLEKYTGNEKLSSFFNDVKDVLEALRPAAPAAEEAAPEAEETAPEAPAAEEKPAKQPKPRKRKNNGPKPK